MSTSSSSLYLFDFTEIISGIKLLNQNFYESKIVKQGLKQGLTDKILKLSSVAIFIQPDGWKHKLISNCNKELYEVVQINFKSIAIGFEMN